MKRLITLFLGFAILNSSIAVTPALEKTKPLNAAEIMIPVGKTGQQISLAEFSKLKTDEYEKLAHVKLNFLDRMKYRSAMKKLRNKIAADGTIKDKKLEENLRSSSDFTEDFHLGGAALGLLLGPIGVLIAYLIEDDNKSVRIKWAWIGFVAWIIFALLIF